MRTRKRWGERGGGGGGVRTGVHAVLLGEDAEALAAGQLEARGLLDPADAAGRHPLGTGGGGGRGFHGNGRTEGDDVLDPPLQTEGGSGWNGKVPIPINPWGRESARRSVPYGIQTSMW